MNLLPHTWPDAGAAIAVVIFFGGLVLTCTRHLKTWFEHLIASVLRELMPNGGTSLRDAVDRTGKKVEALTAQVTSIDGALRDRTHSIEHIDDHVDRIDVQAAHTNERLEQIEVKMDGQHKDMSKRLTALERRRDRAMPPAVREALNEPQKQEATKAELKRNLKGRGDK